MVYGIGFTTFTNRSVIDIACYYPINGYQSKLSIYSYHNKLSIYSYQSKLSIYSCQIQLSTYSYHSTLSIYILIIVSYQHIVIIVSYLYIYTPLIYPIDYTPVEVIIPWLSYDLVRKRNGGAAHPDEDVYLGLSHPGESSRGGTPFKDTNITVSDVYMIYSHMIYIYIYNYIYIIYMHIHIERHFFQ